MNSAHLHLMLTHVPVFGTLFGLALLLLGMARKSEDVKRLSLLVFMITGILALPTYLTGAPAENQLRNLFPTTPLETAEQHEEVAILALVAVLFVGMLALAGSVIFQKGKLLPGWFTKLVLVLAIISTAALAWTANLGGKVRHTEIRHQEPAAAPSGH